MYHYDDLRVVHVATHHKTGSVWYSAVFRDFARRTGHYFVPHRAFRADPGQHLDRARRARGVLITLSQQGGYTPEEIALGRVLHMVRDPRDLLVSATNYHLHATEGFLSRPWRDATGGVSYQQHLRALPRGEARLRFEMSAHTDTTLAQLRDWLGAGARVMTLRYEDCIDDPQMRVFGQALRFAGFKGADFAHGLAAMQANSLFGGLRSARRRAVIRPAGTPHIRSGRAGDWCRAFTPALARDFAALHGDLLSGYGYAADDTWTRAPELVENR